MVTLISHKLISVTIKAGGDVGIKPVALLSAFFFFLRLPAPDLSAASSGTVLSGEGAAPSGPLVLTLEDAVRRALEQSLDLKRRLIDLSTAEYSAGRLWSFIFPGISAGGGASYDRGLLSSDSGKHGYELSAGVSLSLNAGISRAMKMTVLAYDLRMLEYEDARRMLDIEIAKNFYTLIAERANLSNLQNHLELAEKQLERDRVAFRNGVKGELAFLQSRLGAETARYNLSTARTSYADRLGEFLELLGLPQDTDVEFAGDMDIRPVNADGNALIRQYLSGRPDIVQQRKLIESLEHAEKRIVLERRAPSVSLQGRWNLSHIDPLSDRLSGSVSVSIPVDSWIPGTSTFQQIRSAGAELEKARIDLKNTEQAASARIRSLASALVNSWTSVEIARLSVEMARRTYELNEQGFLGGAVESLSLEESRNSLALRQQQLLESELSYKIMTLDLAAALDIARGDIVAAVRDSGGEGADFVPEGG
ncbi:MAG: TolC family protein [Treponema sp.]|jgi:multidrug efflux system outer membrane protein|nr:TolC family protein [Treponema sp.]